MTKVKILIVATPLGCPFRKSGMCSIADRDWDEVAPDCNDLIFPAFCPLKDVEISIKKEAEVLLR